MALMVLIIALLALAVLYTFLFSTGKRAFFVKRTNAFRRTLLSLLVRVQPKAVAPAQVSERKFAQKMKKASVQDQAMGFLMRVKKSLEGQDIDSLSSARGRDSFFFPSRLLIAFGMSISLVFVILISLWAVVSYWAHNFTTLRSESIGYRLKLFAAKSVYDDLFETSESMLNAVPPYSDSYDFIALVYTIIDTVYGENSGITNMTLSAVFSALIASGVVVFVSFYNWVMTMRNYRRMMMELRANPEVAPMTKFPLSVAGTYVGRQVWCCAVTAVLIYFPVLMICFVFFWDPTRNAMSALIVPVIALACAEGFAFTLRFFTAKFAIQGQFVVNRRLFALNDLIGLYIHMTTSLGAAIVRLGSSYLITSLSFSRLDIPLFDEGAESMDPGHSSFMA